MHLLLTRSARCPDRCKLASRKLFTAYALTPSCASSADTGLLSQSDAGRRCGSAHSLHHQC